ncbi:leucine-rich alpha-2-glycoprotein-like [Stylophora pistillata]|uniref:leucine-rich alpha-2-glycoprotein-like n=1 Tax=Stylophora pistillata TaxID=50429 RepID=UPI000C0442D9|nr:leucine-rich alpha-2-glycoprotein-like [Stylophora pistillata]
MSNFGDRDLSKNQLKTLPPGVFNNMTWLHGLDLSYNQLEELPPEAFSHNPHLIELFLNNNKLKNLSSDQLPCRIYLFNNHTKRIKHVHVMGSWYVAVKKKVAFSEHVALQQ